MASKKPAPPPKKAAKSPSDAHYSYDWRSPANRSKKNLKRGC